MNKFFKLTKFKSLLYWSILILPIGLFLFIVIGAIYSSFFKTTKFTNTQKTICYFDRQTADPGRGSSAYFKYYVENKEYEILAGYFSDMVIGDKFQLLYENGNPKKAKVLMEEPVFSKDDKTDSTDGKIIKIENKSILNIAASVTFEYYIEGKKYLKWQFVNLDKKKINKGDIFEVKYLVFDKKRSIINFDKKNRNTGANSWP